MADPITWGLINLVKKGIKGVQTTLDGVSDKVSGLPDSLDADFTEVKEAIADVKTDVGNVDTAVSDVKSDTSSIKDTVDTNPLLVAGSVIKSIQRGSVANARGTQTYEINISPVNIEKSVLIFQFNSFVGNGSDSNEHYFSCDLSANKITITSPLEQTFIISFSWQVIEFY